MRHSTYSLALAFLMASAAGISAEEQKIKISFQVPAANYAVRIQEVHQVGEEVWVISQITSTGFGVQVISDVSDSISLNEEVEGKVIHKVLGKTWNWGKDTQNLQYVADAKGLKEQLKKKDAKLVWKRERPKVE